MIATQDMLVGILAISVGGLLVLGALADSAHLMQLTKPRLLAEAIGKRPARAVIATLGALIIITGILIARGWRIQW